MNKTFLYVILALLGVALAYDHFDGRHSSALGTNLAEQWRGIDLSPDLLDAYFNESCYGDEVSFAACTLAMDRIRERLASDSRPDSLKGTQKRFAEIRKTYKAIKDKKREPIAFAQQWSSLKEEVKRHKDKAWITAQGINGLLYLHRDPHTMIVPRSRYEQIIETSERTLFGIGISVRVTSDKFKVIRVLEDSPADHAGVRVGDMLLAIDGEPVSGRSYQEVHRLLSDESKAHLKITLTSLSGEARTLDLTKKQVLYTNVVFKILPMKGSESPVLHLSILRFSQGVCKEVERKLVESLEAGVTAMVLDLRGNPGGPLREAACVADLLLPKDLKIFEARYFDKTKTSEVYNAQVSPTFNYPITTLVDAFTASAAELLAGALQDYRRSLIVGERTYGKGSFQQGRVWLPFDQVVLLETLGLYYLPSNKSPQLVGLTPDIALPTTASESVEREADLFFQVIGKLPTPPKPKLEHQLALLPCTLNLENPEPMFETASVDTQVETALRIAQCMRSEHGMAASYGLRIEE